MTGCLTFAPLGCNSWFRLFRIYRYISLFSSFARVSNMWIQRVFLFVLGLSFTWHCKSCDMNSDYTRAVNMQNLVNGTRSLLVEVWHHATLLGFHAMDYRFSVPISDTPRCFESCWCPHFHFHHHCHPPGWSNRYFIKSGVGWGRVGAWSSGGVRFASWQLWSKVVVVVVVLRIFKKH